MVVKDSRLRKPSYGEFFDNVDLCDAQIFKRTLNKIK